LRFKISPQRYEFLIKNVFKAFSNFKVHWLIDRLILKYVCHRGLPLPREVRAGYCGQFYRFLYMQGTFCVPSPTL
jgi:hypothetical protein